MKFLRSFNVTTSICHGIERATFSVYELNDEQTSKFGGRFAVAQGPKVTDFYIEKYGEDAYLEGLEKYRYEDFFETYRETILHPKLVSALGTIQSLHGALDNLTGKLSENVNKATREIKEIEEIEEE